MYSLWHAMYCVNMHVYVFLFISSSQKLILWLFKIYSLLKQVFVYVFEIQSNKKENDKEGQGQGDHLSTDLLLKMPTVAQARVEGSQDHGTLSGSPTGTPGTQVLEPPPAYCLPGSAVARHWCRQYSNQALCPNQQPDSHGIGPTLKYILLLSPNYR